MSRFDFGSLEAEPSSMQAYYNLAVDATSRDNVVLYGMPAEWQTKRYAETVLGMYNGLALAVARADNRVRREEIFRDARVHDRTITSAVALTNLQIVGRDVLLEQLDVVQGAVIADLAAGVPHVGIVPARFVQPLPANMPPGMTFSNPNDMSTITTPDGLFVVGPDGWEIDRHGAAGLRGAEAARRLGILEHWAGLAVSGEAALEIIEESRAVVLAA